MKNSEKNRITLDGIIDLNIIPKDKKISIASLTALSNKMYKNGVINYMMPQITPKVVSDSQLTLLESLDSKITNTQLLQSISGIDNEKLTEIASLENRVLAIYIESDSDKNLLKRVFEYAQMKNKPIICKIQNRVIDGDGVIFDNINSFYLGLPTRDRLSERVEVVSVIEMVKYFNVPTLLQGVTDIKTLEMIDLAKKSGVNILVEISIHHLIFDDSIYYQFDNYSKIDPPLQSKEGKEKLLEFLKVGKIDMLTSLHHKISESDKSGSFKESEYGVTGLDSILSIYYTELIQKDYLSFDELSKLISKNQAKFLGIDSPKKIVFDISKDTKITEMHSLYFGKVFNGKVEVI